MMKRLSIAAVLCALLTGCGTAAGGDAGDSSRSTSTGSGSASGQDPTRSTEASTRAGEEQARGGEQGAEETGLVNGGFEQPGVSSYEFFSGELGGWTVTQRSVEIIDESYGQVFRARSGDQMLTLNGQSGPGAVRQAVPTEPGERYRLVFYVASDPDPDSEPEGTATLTASAGSASGSYEVAARQDSFRRESLVFEGASGSDTTRVGLASTTQGSDYGPFVDDVFVEPVGSAGGSG